MEKNSKKKDVIVEIKGYFRDDNSVDSAEVSAKGVFMQTPNVFTLLYDECSMQDNRVTKTMVQVWGEEKVVISRMGNAPSQLIMEKGKRHLCQYGTEYGSCLMGVSTQAIQSDLTDNGGRLYFKYMLDANASKISENEVTIQIRECPNE